MPDAGLWGQRVNLKSGRLHSVASSLENIWEAGREQCSKEGRRECVAEPLVCACFCCDGNDLARLGSGDPSGGRYQETRGLTRVSFGSRGSITWRRSLCFHNVCGRQPQSRLIVRSCPMSVPSYRCLLPSSQSPRVCSQVAWDNIKWQAPRCLPGTSQVILYRGLTFWFVCQR